MKKPLTNVTDHALVRYFERVLGVDMETPRRIIGHQVDEAVRLGCCSVVIEGYRYLITDGVVTTVLEASQPDPRTGRQRRQREDDPRV